jgi:hypothetical protein
MHLLVHLSTLTRHKQCLTKVCGGELLDSQPWGLTAVCVLAAMLMCSCVELGACSHTTASAAISHVAVTLISSASCKDLTNARVWSLCCSLI